jgi:hypothetical protein
MGQGWELTIWCSVTGSNCVRPRLDSNLRIVRKGLSVTNALAYSNAELITDIKGVIALGLFLSSKSCLNPPIIWVTLKLRFRQEVF